MTKEEKDLVFKDLCARLPYKQEIKIFNDSWEGCQEGEFDNTMGFHHVNAFLCDRIEIKPYLRPLSSMTEEEEAYLDKKYIWSLHCDGIKICYHREGYWDNDTECDSGEYLKLFNWLNEHHFDYNDLIPKGLALEAPEVMYNI